MRERERERSFNIFNLRLNVFFKKNIHIISECALNILNGECGIAMFLNQENKGFT